MDISIYFRAWIPYHDDTVLGWLKSWVGLLGSGRVGCWVAVDMEGGKLQEAAIRMGQFAIGSLRSRLGVGSLGWVPDAIACWGSASGQGSGYASGDRLRRCQRQSRSSAIG